MGSGLLGDQYSRGDKLFWEFANSEKQEELNDIFYKANPVPDTEDGAYYCEKCRKKIYKRGTNHGHSMGEELYAAFFVMPGGLPWHEPIDIDADKLMPKMGITDLYDPQNIIGVCYNCANMIHLDGPTREQVRYGRCHLSRAERLKRDMASQKRWTVFDILQRIAIVIVIILICIEVLAG